MSNGRSPLERKTIRPGGLNNTSYYTSARRVRAPLQPAPRKRSLKSKAIIAMVLLLVLGGAFMVQGRGAKASPSAASKTPVTAKRPEVKAAPVAVQPAAVNHCADNQLATFLVVSVGERHLWACEGAKTVYDSPVITGMEQHAATLTPEGTYKIYAKVKDTVLTGSDETGSWKDPVSYWMPWLDNQYGTYGFHDATWRDGSEFGKVDPNSDDASHGCVELPLSTAAWVYNWSSVGTTLTVKA